MSKTKAEREWLNKVASYGCIACKMDGYEDSQATIHHIRHGMGMGQRNNHFNVLPLCKLHHQDGGYGVALHAGQEAFEAKYGTETELLEKLREELGYDS